MSYFIFLHRPGAYEFDAKRDRKVKFHGSFGGPQTLITSVTIKCNDFGEPDIVSLSLVVELVDWAQVLHFLGGLENWEFVQGNDEVLLSLDAG